MHDSRPEVFGNSVELLPSSTYRSLLPFVLPRTHPHGLAGAGFSGQGLMPPGHGLGWNRSDGTTQSRSSASSTVVSPCDGDSKTSSGSSNQSGGSVLKEHDYIGLAEVSSSSSVAMKVSPASELDLKLEETDLRLGLGPPDVLHSADGKVGDRHRGNGSGSSAALVQGASTDDASEKRLCEVPWQAQFLRSMEGIRAPSAMDFPRLQAAQEVDATRYAVLHGYPACRFAFAAAKNGVKRAYEEAMAEKRYNHAEIRTGSFDGMAWPAPAPAQILAAKSSAAPETELNHLPQHAKLPAPPFAYEWAFAPFLPKSSVNLASRPDSAVDSSPPAWQGSSKHPECILPAESSVLLCQPSSIENQPASRDAPSQKGQVVGWPPIRSFRKNTLAAHSKTAEDGEGSNETPDGIPGPVKSSPVALYVKVNMDGVPIGRKVDLNAYQSYEALTLALEEMFRRSNAGHVGTHATAGNETVPPELMWSRLINGSDFVLTYEDKEGDWMLVGDVPWGMFVSTVRRLRIMKASEATGLVPRGSRN